MGLAQRVKRKLRNAVLGEASSGDSNFRIRERHGRLPRPNYAYGMLRAADVARYFGNRRITIAEFGVASGAGLRAMVDLAPQIERETSVSFAIFGFDIGTGLPSPRNFKDHPELWSASDFATEDRNALMSGLDGQATVLWGDIAQTVAPFVETISSDAPLGFISVDVDIYTAAKASLAVLLGKPEQYLPAFSIYFDDVSFFFANKWSGELAAIDEFNAENDSRKIDIDRTFPGFRPQAAAWNSHMYVAHILDHPSRQLPREREGMSLASHLAHTRSFGL